PLSPPWSGGYDETGPCATDRLRSVGRFRATTRDRPRGRPEFVRAPRRAVGSGRATPPARPPRASRRGARRPRRASRLCDRDRETERAPHADRARDPDPAAVRLDDPPADREPEAGAGASGLERRPPERREEVRDRIFRDPDARVLDREDDLLAVRLRGDRDPAALGRELDRVPDQVLEELEHTVAVREDGGQLG